MPFEACVLEYMMARRVYIWSACFARGLYYIALAHWRYEETRQRMIRKVDHQLHPRLSRYQYPTPFTMPIQRSPPERSSMSRARSHVTSCLAVLICNLNLLSLTVFPLPQRLA
jgi:hypothetical protein